MSAGDGQPTVTTPVPRQVWEALLRSDRAAVVTQSLPWRDAVAASGRYRDASLLYEFPSGRQVIMPMARRRRLPGWAAIPASWPEDWGVAGPICQDGRISPPEAAAVLADVARRGTLASEIRLSHAADPAWLSAAHLFRVEPVGCYLLDLDGGFEEVWKHRFWTRCRTAVRRAERSSLEIEVDRAGRLMGVFYDLYEKSIRRWAAMQNEPAWLTRRRMTRDTPPSMLALVAEHFGENCATWVAWLRGEPVAAMIVLRHGSYAKPWRVAMDRELMGPVSANNLLQRRAIEEACRDGYRFWDMGFSEPGSSRALFKRKFGATLHFSHNLRAERLPLHSADRVARTFAKNVVQLPGRLPPSRRPSG